MSSDEGGVRSVSSSTRTRRDRLRRAALGGRRGAAAFRGADRFARLAAAFFLAGRFLALRRLEAFARLATGRLWRFVLDFALFGPRRLSLARRRFAMVEIPFKSLTGLR